uniref:Uncharacterized protein n=1 Tax=Arundo donax TaxID=35708 RepID=A0A0A9EGA3_ARUDO
MASHHALRLRPLLSTARPTPPRAAAARRGPAPAFLIVRCSSAGAPSAAQALKINSIPTKPVEGQKTGTSGLRKKVHHFSVSELCRIQWALFFGNVVCPISLNRWWTAVADPEKNVIDVTTTTTPFGIAPDPWISWIRVFVASEIYGSGTVG